MNRSRSMYPVPGFLLLINFRCKDRTSNPGVTIIRFGHFEMNSLNSTYHLPWKTRLLRSLKLLTDLVCRLSIKKIPDGSNCLRCLRSKEIVEN